MPTTVAQVVERFEVLDALLALGRERVGSAGRGLALVLAVERAEGELSRAYHALPPLEHRLFREAVAERAATEGGFR